MKKRQRSSKNRNRRENDKIYIYIYKENLEKRFHKPFRAQNYL